MKEALQSSLRATVGMALLASLALIGAFVSSYMAESFKQERGLGATILGYNRDWLVDGRWWFVAGLLLCLAMAFVSTRKLQ